MISLTRRCKEGGQRENSFPLMWPHHEHYISIGVRVTSPRTLRQCRLTEPLDLLHRDSHRTHRHPALCQGSEEVGGGGVTTSANSTRIFMCNFVTSEFNLSRVSRLWFGFERRRLFSVFLINFIREILNINWVIRLFRINDGNILLWCVNLLGLGRWVGNTRPSIRKMNKIASHIWTWYALLFKSESLIHHRLGKTQGLFKCAYVSAGHRVNGYHIINISWVKASYQCIYIERMYYG